MLIKRVLRLSKKAPVLLWGTRASTLFSPAGKEVLSDPIPFFPISAQADPNGALCLIFKKLIQIPETPS